LVGNFGFKAVAAYGIGYKLLAFAMMLGFGFGSASSILVGNNLGAKNYDRAVMSVVTPAFMNTLVMFGVGLLFYFFPVPFVKIFNSDPEVINICAGYLKITSVSYAFIGAGFVISKALSGAGDTSANMFITLICLWFIQIPLALFYSIYWGMGVEGIWWATVVAMFLHTLATVMWFAQGKWKQKIV
ncbi:MATE family efflux transporter, partial [bacterium]|nr:MATE family efflux transporter [bacterium]